jgi:hypothetical protein
MTSELLNKIVSLKRSVEEIKNLPFSQIMQKTSRVEGVVQDAVFIIEELATEQVRLEKLVDDLVTVGGE